jgi:hypothetical protein
MVFRRSNTHPTHPTHPIHVAHLAHPAHPSLSSLTPFTCFSTSCQMLSASPLSPSKRSSASISEAPATYTLHTGAMEKYNLQDVDGLIVEGNRRVKKVVDGGAIPRHFDSNMKLVFGAPDEVKNANTIARCLTLRALSAMRLVRWAIAQPHTVWSGGRVSERGFCEQNNSQHEVFCDVRKVLAGLCVHSIGETASFQKFMSGTFNRHNIFFINA